MTNHQALLKDTQEKLQKALGHLEYSYTKIQTLSDKLNELDEEGLEVLESLSARFSRVSDIFLSKYVRTVIMENDPGFRGSMRDIINKAEKLGLIDSAEEWLVIRSIRNMVAYDYNDSEMNEFFKLLKTQCPRVLSIKKLCDLRIPL